MPSIIQHQQHNRQCYILKFNQILFGFVSCLDLQNLKYFNLTVQDRLGKTDIRLNIDFLRNTPHIETLNYILMTEYKQIITMPYLLRHQKYPVKIITTKSMFEFAKIYALDFYSNIKKVDQVVSTLSFEEQSIMADKYQAEFSHLQFDQWLKLYQKKQLQNCLDSCIKINYGERYDTENGIIVTPHASGVSIGSACWFFQAVMTKQTLLWVQGMSHHRWRACQEMALSSDTNKCRHKSLNKIDTIVFTNKSLQHISNFENEGFSKQSYPSDQLHCIQFLNCVMRRLQEGKEANIVLGDILLLCDIINYIGYEFKDKYKGIIITGFSASKMVSYANSLVEYLHPTHRGRIYEDPPVYPFQTYQDLKIKRIIMEGTLEEIAIQKKIPVKQLLLRALPYIHFISDFYQYLHGGCQSSNEIFTRVGQLSAKRVSIEKIQKWISSIECQRIVYFCDQSEGDKLMRLNDMLGNKMIRLSRGQSQKDIYFETTSSQVSKYYTIEGNYPPSNFVSKYQKINGWLILQPYLYSGNCCLVSKDWPHLVKMLVQQQRGLEQVQVSQNQIRLSEGQTILILKDYRFEVKSRREEDLLMLGNVLTKIIKKFT